MNPVCSNSALVTTAGAWPRNGSMGWKSEGGTAWEASPPPAVHLRQFSTPAAVRTRYPTTPCSPGEVPVVIEVSAVAVVLGATVVMHSPGAAASKGATAAWRRS